MKGFSAFLGMRRCKDLDHKISSLKYLSIKICPTRFPGTHSASLHPKLSQGLLKVNSCSSTGFSLHNYKVTNALIVHSLAVLSASANL